MIKRNLSSILVIIAMLLNILGFDFMNINTASTKFWLFLGATIVLIASVILIFVNESKNNKNPK
ncbi:hypothetical protein ESY86_20785 [Subsaximicrobium wynnwilliamsii]|jgi:hypothetical protein|uniref:Uncharacterized protein n=2 Tax=Subsaximicrobium wynnwilliamsii TaxID=291179 RepID=A0A5C6Z9I6_9FLAO|nr:hypothetical protein ESY87_20780 [Subsaximicrobium wynnwilliamsii]TXD85806.1 hypothetical protein ESY86_20785 [Subsaximicrobium wynnwilliamsii]TXD99049.1 hypothetical protein ESY88_20745 [Subsaximicrobium wynnwilliamsii]